MDTSTFESKLNVYDVADYIIWADAARAEPDVTPLKLAKILYLTQANHLAATGHRLFDEDVEAYDNGPVVYAEWKRHPGRQIIAVRDEVSPVRPELNADVTEFVDRIWQRYRDSSASELWNLTHRQRPWKETYKPHSHRLVIADSLMETYFRHEVPLAERVFHPTVTLMPEGFLDDDDSESFAAAYRAHLASNSGQ